jgi:pSer/pThr/pTyr-binding forkhead associated (FHA) protein
MTELILEFKDQYGETKREPVRGESVFVGRHSESDICIPDGRLSRKHLKIDRFGDTFLASDAGSSNGTILNGAPLRDPVALKNGDALELGGLTINVVFPNETPQFSADVPDDQELDAPEAGTSVDSGISIASQPSAAGGSGAMLMWIMIPVFGLIFIMFAGVVLFLIFSSPTTTVAKKQTDTTYTDDDFDSENDNKKPSNRKDDDNTATPSNSTTSSSNSTTTNSGNSSLPNIPTGNLSETAKVEQNGAAFLRLIAQKDPRAFLTTEQATRIIPKIKQFSGSSALAENLKSANKSASQIRSLAQQKGVRPQFLAIAAVAKLGSSRGDVYQTASSIAEVLGKFSGTLGTELADDALVVIAAYGQGAASEPLKMRNTLQELANKSSESARTIRTIWFLQKNGNISQAEFDNALNFLAIGTISQNPKDFGVNAVALTL